MIALLLLSYGCLVNGWLFLTMPWVSLQCVIVVFHDHTRKEYGTRTSILYRGSYICADSIKLQIECEFKTHSRVNNDVLFYALLDID